MADYGKSKKGGGSTGTKVRKSSENGSGKFPMGGSTKMFDKQAANPAVAGIAGKPDARPSGEKYFVKGGSGHMFPKGHASKMPSAQTAKSSN